MNQQSDLQSVYFFSNAAIVMIFSYLVLLMKERGLNETQVGLLAIPFSISLLISNTIFGRLSDVRGRGLFLKIGFASASFSTLLYLLPHSFWQFAIARVLNGIALGIFPSSIVGVASDRGMKLGKLSAYGSIGWATGGLIGGFVADVLSLEASISLSASLYFLSMLISYFRQIGSYDVVSSKSEKVPNMYGLALRKNWLIYFVFLLRHGTANSIWIFWAFFLTEDLGLTTTQMGVVQATNMITQFVFMRTVTDRFRPQLMFTVGGLASSMAFYSFTISHNFSHIVLAQVVLGFSWAMFYVGALRMVELRSKGEGIVATGTGLFNASISMSQVIGPFLAIFFFSISNTYVLSMEIAAIITLVGTVVYILLTSLGLDAS